MANKGIESSNELTCPYCGHIDDCPEEMFSDDLGSDQLETDCESCNKSFVAIRHIDVSYSSFQIEDDGDAA